MTLPKTSAVTPECILAFVHLFKPHPNLNEVLKYSAELLIPKTANVEAIKNAIKAAVEAGQEAKKLSIPLTSGFKNPLRDGDIFAVADPLKVDKRTRYKGHWFMRTAQDPTVGKPKVLGENGMQTGDPEDVQAGDIAISVVDFYAFNKNGSQGVAVSPNMVRKVRTGERFSSGAAKEDALAALGGGTLIDAGEVASAPADAGGETAPADQNLDSMFD